MPDGLLKRSRASVALPALLGLALAGCSAVRHASTQDDFDQVDKKTLLRLMVFTAPLPAGEASAGEMFSEMARRYVNHHRDFIAKEGAAAAALPADACGEGFDGLLHLEPRVVPTEGGAEVEVEGRLLRCADGVEVWRAGVAGSWPSEDPNVSTVIEEYSDEFGSGVTPIAAPAFHALRALLDTLPRPVLEKDDDIMEKIELGD